MKTNAMVEGEKNINSDNRTNDLAFDDVCRFIIKLGTTVHGYGPNAIRIKSYLYRLTTAFGYRGVFRSTPTDMVFAFSQNGDPWQRTHLATMDGTGLELARLARVGELVDAVEAGRVSVPEATVRMKEIDKAPHPWGNLTIAASYAFVGSGFAVLLSGGWWDVFFSAVFSLIVYGMVLLSGRFGARSDTWLPLSSAFVAGVIAASMKILVPELNGVLVTL